MEMRPKPIVASWKEKIVSYILIALITGFFIIPLFLVFFFDCNFSRPPKRSPRSCFSPFADLPHPLIQIQDSHPKNKVFILFLSPGHLLRLIECFLIIRSTPVSLRAKQRTHNQKNLARLRRRCAPRNDIASPSLLGNR